mmetsp:Transcript_40217/g.97139  ORF Transcript_40217/g.97139 Transcript_40217/m.97139 type:complete len:204 (-) Transcript_40217:251-862(-)
MVPDRVTELLVLFLEESDRLLEGFQQELLADTAALGVFTVAFTAVRLLCIGHLPVTRPGRLLLGHGVLQVMTFLRRLLERDGLRLAGRVGGRTHDECRLLVVVQLRRVQPTTLLGLPTVRLRRHRGDTCLTGREGILFFRHEDGVTVGGEHDIAEDVVKVQGGHGFGFCLFLFAFGANKKLLVGVGIIVANRKQQCERRWLNG